MKIAKFHKKLHDPWGNKYHNVCGSIIRLQYMVGKGSLTHRYEHDAGNPGKELYYVDRCHNLEATGTKFVRIGKHSTEKMRR